MTDDRELLVSAAWAAGIDIFWAVAAGYELRTGGVWNPLTDDGDRYRLAKKLDIRIHFGPAHVTYAVNGISRILRWPEDASDDSYAIVRAAAEIGMSMPGNPAQK